MTGDLGQRCGTEALEIARMGMPGSGRATSGTVAARSTPDANAY